jgi:la-related protein 1
MAGPGVSSPGGFSYAQAAKGRVSTSASQAPSSKVTSGAATPAAGLLSEFETASPSNWADDVDLAVTEKQSQSNEESSEKTKTSELKSVVERTKAEEKAQTSSGLSSPDPAASATSNDDSASANNGSSQTSWDGKSQGSETPQTTEAAASGSWITARAERAERQSDSRHKHESSGKSKKHKAEKTEEPPAPPPKPVVLTEAPAPVVNPWAKLAEANKAKQASSSQPAAKPAQAPGAATNLKENQRPRADSKKKTNPTSSTSEVNNNGDAKKSSQSQGKRSDEQRVASRQAPKPAAGAQRADVNVPGYSRPAVRDERPNTAAPPPVKDEVSWPTPDTAPVPEPKERKPAPEKESDDKTDESAPTGKSRKKQEWKTVPVVPNILWETPVMREKSVRAVAGNEGRGRGGATVRGRGNFRGTANGVTTRAGAPGDDARQSRPESSDEAAVKTQRSVSASSQSRSASKVAVQQPKDITSADTKPLPQRSTKPKAEITGLEGQEIELAPEFIPRGPKAEDVENTQGQAARLPMGEKPAGNYNGSGRGTKRGGRGRGGSREFGNGHHGPAHPFVSGTPGPDFSNVSPFGAPQSPSFQPPRGNHQGNFAGPGRAGWRGNSRAQSFPVENSYGRYPSFPVPMPAYGNGLFDYGGYPVQAVPYNPMQDPNYVFSVVTLQLEYYFSLDNLLKDMYLRKNMDSQGFVYLEVIASFNRVKSLTQDWELLKQVCLQSNLIEIRVGEDGKERVRKSHDYEQFVLPMPDRFPAARHEGPTKLEVPEQRMPAMYPMHMASNGMHHPMSMPRPGDRRDNTHAMMNGAARGAFFSHNGENLYEEEVRGRSQKPPVFNNNVPEAYMSNGNLEPDVFPEHKLEQLTVCVRLAHRRVPYHTANARTFSNGSIDQRTIAGDISRQNAAAQLAANGEAVTNGTSSPAHSRAASPSASSSQAGDHVFWIKDTEEPVDTLPSDLTRESYVHLRLKALEQREHAATGTCPYDLKVLYQFWSHFLIRNFNNRMYNEFKYYADTDAKDRVSFEGQEALIKYYCESVGSANPLPTRVVNDYIELLKTEGPKVDSELFKSLQSAWLNKALNLRNRKKLSDILDSGLKAQLEA